MPRAANPYAADPAGAVDPRVTSAAGPSPEYAVPSADAPKPYATDWQGWAPSLRTESTGTPDAERVGVAPIRQRQVFPNRPPEDWYDAFTDYDDARRHSVEAQDANGFAEVRTNELRRAPDPRWNPPQPSRVTAFRHPRTYAFWRPFQRPPARNNGLHFSMADHRRTYDVLGMEPVPQRRNTFRVDPSPWDAEIYDVPPSASPVVTPGRVQGVDIAPRRGSFRTGG